MKSIHQQAELIAELAFVLNGNLSTAILSDAFCKQEEEAYLVFRFPDQQGFTLVFNTSIRQSLFLFHGYELPRPNGVQPLFRGLIGKEVLSVLPLENERSFGIIFNQATIWIKAWGPTGNLLGFENQTFLESFRKSIKNDQQLKLPHWSESLSLPANKGYWVYQIEDDFFITKEEQSEGQKLLFTFDLLEALDFFSSRAIQKKRFLVEKERQIKKLQEQIKKQESVLRNNTIRLQKLEETTNPEEIGHILMANLHNLKKGMKLAHLHDFFRDREITIKLQEELSPQDNAARYYRKAKNQKLEFEQARSLIAQAKEKLVLLNEHLSRVESSEALRELKKTGKDENLPQKNASGFKEFDCLGFRIYVGRNSENNDELTLKFAHKDDLWLHAKGVSGSHVIIRHQQGKNFPEPVIQRAAELAAYFSKSRSMSMIAVSVTPKKFVRKPKGALPGQVRVEREEIILAEPKL